MISVDQGYNQAGICLIHRTPVVLFIIHGLVLKICSECVVTLVGMYDFRVKAVKID